MVSSAFIPPDLRNANLKQVVIPSCAKGILMVYAYIRVSTDRQTVENQRFEIEQFCARNNMRVDRWLDETISGTKDVEERKLGNFLQKMTRGDILICAELSRLGRKLLMIMSILNECMKRELQVWTIKDNYRLGADINSQVLAFAFGLCAEVERNLISQRTKEALARRRREGVKLGRPKGVAPPSILVGRESEVQKLLDEEFSCAGMARVLGVSRETVKKYLKETGFDVKGKKPILADDLQNEPHHEWHCLDFNEYQFL